MAFCGSCGGELRSGARFCATCGQSTVSGATGPATVGPAKARAAKMGPPSLPAPVEPSSSTSRNNVALIAALAILAIVIGVTVGLVLVSGGGDDASTAASSDPGSEERSPPNVTESGEAPVSAPVTVAPDPDEQARQELEAQIEEDRSFVEAELTEYWVPQLSSKLLGTTDGETGITYSTYQSILDLHRDLTSSYGAVLIDSAEFASFGSEPPYYYVSVAPVPFSSGEEANQWCDQQGLSSNDCFAKLISHTDRDNDQVYR